MKKTIYTTLLLVLALLLCACTDAEVDGEVTSSFADRSSLSLPTDNESSTTSDVSSDSDVTSDSDSDSDSHVSNEPTHSDLYLPQYSSQQMFDYFEEVVLHVEYNLGTGDTALVQKWNQPLYYRMYGSPTQEDLAVLNQLFAQLNAVEGFPGIYEAADGTMENLSISFLNPDDFRLSFSEILNGEEAFGATQFWYYNDTNEIYTANVGYRTDVDQSVRASVLIEEIINTLGITDTVLREDSIVYQYSDANTALSDVDWTILKLLYDPSIQSGMDAESCREVVNRLYY